MLTQLGEAFCNTLLGARCITGDQCRAAVPFCQCNVDAMIDIRYDWCLKHLISTYPFSDIDKQSLTMRNSV